MRKVKIPYHFEPRDYQLPLCEAMDSGYKRAVTVWHRRSGKDKTWLNICIKKMFQRVGSYYYFFPTYTQGQKILWEGMDRDGFKFMGHFPKEVVESKNDTKMQIKTKNGSLFQIIGTDNIDSVVGTNPVGCVFSEFSLQDPATWDFIRPILAENGGWAGFEFTPRGENHAFDIYNMAKNDPKNWFCQLLTVDDTQVISADILANERREIVLKDGNDALFKQEYYCDFSVPLAGAYYAEQIMQAYKDGRVCNIPIEQTLPVDTYWDLGIGDSMSIWFVQQVGTEIRVVDYYENNGQGLPHYIQVMKDKGYIYGNHYAPHDIEVRELTSGKSRRNTAAGLGIDFNVAPKLPIMDGIDASRSMFNNCWFDKNRTEVGLNALKNYHKEFDEKKKCFKNQPAHDWSSHAADAFRTMAVSIDIAYRPKTDRYTKRSESVYTLTPDSC